MRSISMNLWSTSAMALVLIASPAAAQTVDPATPPDPTVEAQEQPADPEAGVAQTDDEGDTIVVTGLRRSLQSAQNIKRNSEQQVDAIVAEDIGKLPDIAVSDTAARIPGFQVERERGEAGRVLLRGLDRQYYTTTYNGREIFTAETRSVALQDFPAGGIAAIEAFKTSTANLVEPGIAGLVNVRSRRPFDFQGFELAGSVWGVYPNQSRDFTPNFQLLASNRWEAGEGDIGALLNFSYTRLHYQDSIRRHGFFIAGLAGGRAPDYPELRYNEGDRWRPSVNGALQWRPNPDLEIYAEGLWQGYREEITDRMWNQPLWSCGPDATYSNIVFRPGTDLIESGTVTTPGCPGSTWGFQGATKRKTNTYQFALGGRYDAGPLRVTADLARTNSRFDLRTESVDFEINRRDYSVDFVIGSPGGPGPTLEVVGLDTTNPANYNYRGFYEDYLTAKGEDWQGRVDFEYESAMDFLPNLQWGVRYVDRDASRRAGDRFWPMGHLGIPISEVPLDYQLFRPAFRGDDDKPFPRTWFAPTFKSVWNNLTELRQFNVDNGTGTAFGNNDINDPDMEPLRSFDINEKSLAGYLQGQFRFDAGSIPIHAIVGLRGVETKDRIEGVLVPPGGVPEPIQLKNKYTDWLPNANVRIEFTPEIQLRLAATKTRTRPLFEQLNPALELQQPPIGCVPGQSDCVRRASGGNPFLDPLESDNYDASLEYYFSRTGFASVAIFRRDLKGFIVNRTFEYPEPDEESGLPLLVSGPVNTDKGRIDGFEAQISTFFDWGWMPNWARGFGAQANVTYLDPTLRMQLFEDPLDPEESPGFEIRERIPDVSKWTYNLVAMYEAHGLTARLAYNRRSRYPEGGLSERGDHTLQGRGRAVSRLDWSSSYTINDNFTLFFDWTNILKKPFKSDIVRINYDPDTGVRTGKEVFPLVYRFEESVMSGGIRFRFGGARARVADAAPPLPPPPPPMVEPAPPVEPPPPPPPPPPEPSGQRG